MALFGCQRDAVAPPLVDITEVTPRELELGDHLELRGAGFPQGRPARVTFEGSLFRAGDRPVRSITIEADGTVTTPDRLEVILKESLIERFCGHGDQGAHATFRGDVEVAFDSATPGAPPLVGRRRAITLDVRPSSVRAAVLEARANEGMRVLSYFGIVPGPITSRGLPIERVTPGSPAHRAGIETGDVLVALDGVNVRDVGDVVPLSARSTEITIRHPDSGNEESKTLSMLAYAGERIPTELAPALVIVPFALVILLLLVAPGPRSLALLELRIASSLRQKRILDLAKTLFGKGTSLVLSILVSAILAAVAFLAPSSSTDLDGVILFAIATVLLVASRVAAARGFVGSLRVLLDVGTAALSMSGALAVLIAHHGGVSLSDLARAQGGAPWEMTAATHPASAILGFGFAAALVSVLRVQGAPILERIALLLCSALATIVFFGAWHVPGLEASRGAGTLFLGGLLFVLKTWIFAGAVWAAAYVAGSHPSHDLRRVVVRRFVPGILLAAGLVALSRKLLPSAALETACGATSAALFVLLAVRLGTRVRAALLRPEPHASPFL